MDIVNSNILMEPDTESSNPYVTNQPAVRQYIIASKRQTISKGKPRKDVKVTEGGKNIEMIIPTSSDRKRKKYCCVYCHKRYFKLVPHLLDVHKNEAEVKKIRGSPPGKTLF